MITNSKKRRLYDLAINYKIFTSIDLFNCGFCIEDFDKLEEDGYIKKIDNNLYEFINVKVLFNYGRDLRRNNNYDDLYKCFFRCFELDPTNIDIIYELFIRCIIDDNYDDLFKYYDLLLELDKYHPQELNLYIFLINHTYHYVPTKYGNIKDMPYDKIKHLQNGKDKYKKNKILTYIYNQRFFKAYSLIEELLDKTTREEFVTKLLVKKALTKQQEITRNIDNMIDNNMFNEVVEYLDSIKNAHYLCEFHKYIRKITFDYLVLLNTGEILDMDVDNVITLKDAMEVKDYNKVYQINKLLCDYEKPYSMNNTLDKLLEKYFILKLQKQNNKLIKSLNHKSIYDEKRQ